jgi:1-phosphatidylinositol-3-phosphate 5-kinase
VWEEAEVYSAVVSRKEHPRDPTSILSIRDVLRKAPVDTASVSSPSRLTSAGFSKAGIPPSAWSKPAVEINTQPADGEVVLPENDGGAGQILQEMEATTDERGLSRNNTITETTYGSSTSNSSAFESTIQASSILSTVEKDDVNGKAEGETESPVDEGSGTAENEQRSDNPPKVPPKPLKPEAPTHPAHSPRSSISTSIALVMKQIMNTGESTPPPVPKKSYHGLLSLEPSAADNRPHIKYDWTVGKRLKFSCTVYYAKQFDLVRKRCGIEATYLKSIEKSANWLAEGGKSRSNFWKTADDRFIIKTLVDAWNVADL